MTGLGSRLVVVDHTGVCDGPGQHDVRLITDGHTAYAYGLGTLGVDCRLPHRDNTTVTVSCNQYHPPCDGRVTADLAAEDAWTAAPEALALLEQYGEVVDR